MRLLKDYLIFLFQSFRHQMKGKKKSLIPLDDVKINFQGGLETKIQRISFEISNTCNYTSIHPECPVSCYKHARILDENIVFKVIDELK